MGDTVRLRPNHYETLGLTPAASAQEIAKAFAKQLTLLPIRPYGWLAQVSVAHETLRDPAKRKAYDAALFPKPAAAPPPRRASPHPVFAQLIRPASPEPVKQSPPAPFVATPPPARGHEWKPAPPATIMFREPRPAASEIPTAVANETPPLPAAKPEELVRQAIIEEHGLEAIAPARATPRRDPPEPTVPDSEASVDWRLPALAAGAVILAIAGGAWAGLEVGNDNQQVPPDRIATLSVPPARPALEIEALPPGAPVIAEAQSIQRTRARVASVERIRPPLEIDLAEGQPAAQSDPAQPESAAAEPLVAEVPADVAPVAELPLPKSIIARTIHRIGYGCGQVASTAAIDGEAGAFKVTCTSGQSYRAAPVRGRYHFRRMAGR